MKFTKCNTEMVMAVLTGNNIYPVLLKNKRKRLLDAEKMVEVSCYVCPECGYYKNGIVSIKKQKPVEAEPVKETKKAKAQPVVEAEVKDEVKTETNVEAEKEVKKPAKKATKTTTAKKATKTTAKKEAKAEEPKKTRKPRAKKTEAEA